MSTRRFQTALISATCTLLSCQATSPTNVSPNRNSPNAGYTVQSITGIKDFVCNKLENIGIIPKKCLTDGEVIMDDMEEIKNARVHYPENWTPDMVPDPGDAPEMEDFGLSAPTPSSAGGIGGKLFNYPFPLMQQLSGLSLRDRENNNSIVNHPDKIRIEWSGVHVINPSAKAHFPYNIPGDSTLYTPPFLYAPTFMPPNYSPLEVTTGYTQLSNPNNPSAVIDYAYIGIWDHMRFNLRTMGLNPDASALSNSNPSDDFLSVSDDSRVIPFLNLTPQETDKGFLTDFAFAVREGSANWRKYVANSSTSPTGKRLSVPAYRFSVVRRYVNYNQTNNISIPEESRKYIRDTAIPWATIPKVSTGCVIWEARLFNNLTKEWDVVYWQRDYNYIPDPDLNPMNGRNRSFYKFSSRGNYLLFSSTQEFGWTWFEHKFYTWNNGRCQFESTSAWPTLSARDIMQTIGPLDWKPSSTSRQYNSFNWSIPLNISQRFPFSYAVADKDLAVQYPCVEKPVYGPRGEFTGQTTIERSAWNFRFVEQNQNTHYGNWDARFTPVQR